MKRFQIIFLFLAALVALLAAAMFADPGLYPSRSTGVVGVVATSSQDSLPALSPDAFVPRPPTSSVSVFDLGAQAAAVGDLGTGAMLYGFNADTRWPVASITKLMTAEIVLDLMDPQGVIILAPEDFSGGPSALTANLEPGDQYRVQDLLKVLLVPSSNEAANAFARSYGRAAFLAAMNSKAAAWGLANTHFDDPSGISVANQSTPREFLELMRRIYFSHPEVFAITQARTATARELTTGLFRQFSSTNNFAGRAGFLGGKTGTTPEAGDNLVSIFETGGSPVAVLVFGAVDRWAATASLLQLIR
jgi:D-alanyl-D-alanine carboxypeptidase